MSGFNFFDIIPKFSTPTMFVIFTAELFVGFEIICSTLRRFCYGQEELEYPALLILFKCCAINICGAGISRKVISLPQTSCTENHERKLGCTCNGP
jgi:hypothetical protein